MREPWLLTHYMIQCYFAIEQSKGFFPKFRALTLLLAALGYTGPFSNLKWCMFPDCVRPVFCRLWRRALLLQMCGNTCHSSLRCGRQLSVTPAV